MAIRSEEKQPEMFPREKKDEVVPPSWMKVWHVVVIFLILLAVSIYHFGI